MLSFSLAEGPGRHWFCAFRSSEDILEVFDSLAISLNLVKKYFKYKCKVEANTVPVQCYSSKTCGDFVAYFILNRMFNLDMEFEDIVNELFTLNCEKNEKRVKNFLSSL
jgi:hypothetical protein